ncbi:MAG: DUF2585 family protein [Pyrinomonadaceae bacterium]
MTDNRLKRALPFIATLLVLAATAWQLHHQGRLWWCSCGRFLFWSSDAWSSETSQQFLDPYSFTHILHGMAFYGLLALTVRRLPLRWRFWLAIVIESLWEVIENTNLVIQRYRETTAALGYQGDSVVNSLGDILACGLGFWLARMLGFRRSVILFVLIESMLLLVIRDSLILNIVMLIYPIDALKAWQAGH